MEEYNYKNYLYNIDNSGGYMVFNQYNAIIDLLQHYQPKRICQLGCGQTTSIFQQYCAKNNDIVLFSIEHDGHWARNNTILFPLMQGGNLTVSGKVYNFVNYYICFEEWLSTQKPFDFICIDGPPGWGFRQNYNYSRVQLLSFILLDKINHNSIVLFHDSQRKNAKNTLAEFQKLLTEKEFNFQKIEISSPFNYNPAQLTVYFIK